MILVNANDPAMHEETAWPEMQARAKSRGMKVPYVVDETSAVARAFGAQRHARGVPVRQERQARLPRHVDDNRQEPDKVQKRYLKDALDAVVAGKTPAVPETKGLGCGIKFHSNS